MARFVLLDAGVRVSGEKVVIATTNVRHRSRFPGVVVKAWGEV